MKMKLSISVSLSHKAELLILDEATSGLDPVIRDDTFKRFYMTKANILVAFLLCIVMTIGLSIVVSPSILVAIPLSIIVSSTIISNKKNKWTQFTITLPVTKKQIISS